MGRVQSTVFCYRGFEGRKSKDSHPSKRSLGGAPVGPLDGGAESELKGLSEGDRPLQWHSDSQNIFVEHQAAGNTVEIYSLNLATGERKLWTKFSPDDKAAVLAIRRPILTPDGARAVYVVQRIYSTLFVGKGFQ